MEKRYYGFGLASASSASDLHAGSSYPELNARARAVQTCMCCVTAAYQTIFFFIQCIHCCWDTSIVTSIAAIRDHDDDLRIQSNVRLYRWERSLGCVYINRPFLPRPRPRPSLIYARLAGADELFHSAARPVWSSTETQQKVHICGEVGATFAGPMVVVVTPRTRRRARTLIVLGVALLGFAADQGTVTSGGPPTLRSHMWDLKATMELPTQGSGSWTERESNAGVSKLPLRELEEAGLGTRQSARERSFAENGIARRNRSGSRRPSGVVKQGRVGKLSPGTLQHKLALQEQELEALRARRSGEEDAVKLGQAEMLLEKIQVRSDECARKPPNSTNLGRCIKEYHARVFFARRYIGAPGHQPRGFNSSTKTSPSTPRRS